MVVIITLVKNRKMEEVVYPQYGVVDSDIFVKVVSSDLMVTVSNETDHSICGMAIARDKDDIQQLLEDEDFVSISEDEFNVEYNKCVEALRSANII